MKKIGFLFIFLFLTLPIHAKEVSLLSLASPYKKVVRKYTKEKAKYSINHFDVKYRWFATYHSPEFINAFQKQFDKLYPEGAGKYPAEQKSKLESPNQSIFMVSLYARKAGMRKLAGEKSLWEIDLFIEGETIKPVSIEPVRVTPFQTSFYPYLQKWYTFYRVTFPVDLVARKPHQVSLQLSGVEGISKITFDKL